MTLIISWASQKKKKKVLYKTAVYAVCNIQTVFFHLCLGARGCLVWEGNVYSAAEGRKADKKEYILIDRIYIKLQKMPTNPVTENRPVFAGYKDGVEGLQRHTGKPRKWQECLVSWFHQYIYTANFSKHIKLYTLNMYSLLYAKSTSRKWWKEKHIYQT